MQKNQDRERPLSSVLIRIYFPMTGCHFLLYRKLRFRKAKKIICPAERPLRVLGDGRIENGRRVTAKPFSCGCETENVSVEKEKNLRLSVSNIREICI